MKRIADKGADRPEKQETLGQRAAYECAPILMPSCLVMQQLRYIRVGLKAPHSSHGVTS